MESQLPRIQQQLQSLASVYRDGLLRDVIPFWINHGFDKQYGGLISSLDEKGQVIDTDKSVWIQGRFVWMLGELLNHPLTKNHPDRLQWLAAAESTTDFIEKHCFDPTDGRMWFHVTREGKSIRKRRYAFSESFAAIAFGEMAKLGSNIKYAETANRLFRNFVEHTIQNDQKKFTETRPMKSIGFPMITIASAQQLRDSIELDVANEWIERSITEIRNHFCKPEIECVMESVAPSGERIDHFDGRLLNPGHAIEAAWFILEEGKWKSDKSLVELGCQMLDWMWKRGWDTEYGGLLYFVDVDGKPVQEYWHDMKFWWPHNELIIATLLAYQLTGDEKYWVMFQAAHQWSHEHFPDEQNGEWFGYLHRDGQLSTRLKGNLWKGPFHIPRMQLKCWELLEELSTEKED